MVKFSRFKIYCQAPSDKKRRKESDDLAELLQNLDRFVKLDDVQFGQPPHEPDFVFHYNNKQIGVELTDLDPKVFEAHGYEQRGKFKTWRAEVEPDATIQRFDWGTYTLRESLASFKEQLDRKRKKAENWLNNFQERWLLMHVAGGSPFSEVFEGKWQMVPGKEKDVDDYLAKSTYGVDLICQEIQPFDCVILFMQDDFLTFPAHPANRYGLPVPKDKTLKRGAEAPDKFLDWKNQRRSAVKAVC